MDLAFVFQSGPKLYDLTVTVISIYFSCKSSTIPDPGAKLSVCNDCNILERLALADCHNHQGLVPSNLCNHICFALTIPWKYSTSVKWDIKKAVAKTFDLLSYNTKTRRVCVVYLKDGGRNKPSMFCFC